MTDPSTGLPVQPAAGTSAGASGDAPAVRLKPIARPALAVGALVLVGVLVAAAFVVGLNLRLPETREQTEASKPRVTAQVEERVVQEGVQMLGTVVAPETLPIALAPEAAAAAGERTVVTRRVLMRGQRLAPGRLLAEVSGRPVIAVSPNMPLYRDFALGNSGADVRALQRLLTGLGYPLLVDGKLNAATMRAISSWYERLGYTLPKAGKGRVLPWRELVPLPTGKLTVVKLAKRGSVVGGEQPLLTVRRGAPVVTVDVDAVQVEEFRNAMRAYLMIEGESRGTRVLSIGELVTNSETGESSYPITIRLPRSLEARAVALGTVPVTTAAPAAPSMAVPLVAIEEDGSGQFVTLAGGEAQSGDGTTATRVPVEVVAVAGGWAAIAEDELLPVGTKLRVG